MSNTSIQNTRSRRRFFGASAAALGVGAAAVASIPKLGAQTTPAPSDLDVLNYALRLENLESNFYTQGLAKFTASDFANSDLASTQGSKVSGNLYTYFQAIMAHEQAHVTTITSVINSLGGKPVAADCYNFGFTTADAFIAAAQVLENTGVMAYDGAIALIQNPQLVQAAATIATVEARHASYLNLVNRGIPFPAPFDTPQTMAQILAVAAGFITGCGTGNGGGPTTPPAGAATQAVANPKGAAVTTNMAMLDGSQSVSGSGALQYLWRTVYFGGIATIASPTSATTAVTLLGGKGVYVFTLQVTDAAGKVSTDTAKIIYG